MERVDVAIVGGGPAGMTAALVLGRARKEVIVVDAGKPRHAVSEGVHNLLAREGIAPAELRRQAWEQMRGYPSARLVREEARALVKEAEGWRLEAGERSFVARAVLLAVGVVDAHPEIVGYGDKWGHSIHHCPYCHGWEVRDQALAVLAAGEAAGHIAPLLRGWSNDVVLLTNGGDLSDAARDDLLRREIPIRDEGIVSLEGEGRALSHIVFDSGEKLAREGLFVAAVQHPVPLVASLGLALDGPFVRVDAEQRTSVPGLWAAGDCTTFRQAVTLASAQGMMAAVTINAELTAAHHS